MSANTRTPQGGSRVSEILSAADLHRTLRRIGYEINEKLHGLDDVVIVSILSGGAEVGDRLAEILGDIANQVIPVNQLDMSPYRDDLESDTDQIVDSEMKASVAGKQVILVDDVVQTGRSARAALQALLSHGRPRSVQFAVVVAREGREMPIEPEFVGKNLGLHPTDYVEVNVDKGVFLYQEAEV